MSRTPSDRTAMQRPSAFFRFFLLFLAGLLFIACGDPQDLSEEMSTPPPIEYLLTAENHPDGYGLSECLFCHPIFKIHQKASNPDVDLEQIRKMVDQLGQDSCMFCHGRNGT
jgi:hypothetical protein